MLEPADNLRLWAVANLRMWVKVGSTVIDKKYVLAYVFAKGVLL